MKIESIIKIVNRLCDDHKYSKVRPIILSEWKRLTESKNYHFLNSNAQQFLKIIEDEKSLGYLESLTNSEKKVLNLINTSIRQTQFRYARQIISQHHGLLEMEVAQKWLTADAKIIYEAWKKSI